MTDFESLRGQLLISLPYMQGDYFQHTVTLLIEHSRSGSFGLVINRPLTNSLSEVLAGNDIDCSRDLLDEIVLLDSGPVETDRLFFLHTGDRHYQGSLKINPDVTLSTSLEVIEDLNTGSGPQHTLAGLGYAGWSAGQLEDEILRDVWLVTPCHKSVVFETPFEERPEEAARLCGINLNLISPNPGHG